MSPDLQRAFQYHHRDLVARAAISRAVDPSPFIKTFRGRAAETALKFARRDVIEGKARYPGPVRVIHASDTATGLRLVGRVVPETNRHDFWDTRESCGWHTDPHGDVFKDGTGLCYGLVYQLAGRNGESRFVAGYEFGGCDGGPTLNMSRIFTESRCDYSASPRDLDAARAAARAAARHADQLAKAAAEQEREYQTAWRAGSNWSDLLQEEQQDRRQLIEILQERRAVKGSGSYPALCAAIRSTVQRLLDRIKKSRAERAELASGDSSDLYFWNGDKRLQDAFCEGANLDAFPGAVA